MTVVVIFQRFDIDLTFHYEKQKKGCQKIGDIRSHFVAANVGLSLNTFQNNCMINDIY
jgi:hypothetical protein